MNMNVAWYAFNNFIQNNGNNRHFNIVTNKKTNGIIQVAMGLTYNTLIVIEDNQTTKDTSKNYQKAISNQKSTITQN